MIYDAIKADQSGFPSEDMEIAKMPSGGISGGERRFGFGPIGMHSGHARQAGRMCAQRVARYFEER
jgi:hypothetical protein